MQNANAHTKGELRAILIVKNWEGVLQGARLSPESDTGFILL